MTKHFKNEKGHCQIKNDIKLFFFVSTLHDYESNGKTNYFLGERLRTCKISFFSEYTPINL